MRTISNVHAGRRLPNPGPDRRADKCTIIEKMGSNCSDFFNAHLKCPKHRAIAEVANKILKNRINRITATVNGSTRVDGFCLKCTTQYSVIPMIKRSMCYDEKTALF